MINKTEPTNLMRSPKFCPIITHTTWPIIPSRINKFVFDLVPKTNGKVQVAQGRARGYGEHSTHYQDCATVLPCTYLACRQISRVSWGFPRRRLGHENRIMPFSLPQYNHAICDYIRGWFLGIVSPYNTTFKPDLRSPTVRIVVVIVVIYFCWCLTAGHWCV